MLVTSELQVPPKETSRAGTEEHVVSISSKTVAEGKGDGEVTPSLCANRSLLNMCLRTEEYVCTFTPSRSIQFPGKHILKYSEGKKKKTLINQYASTIF